MDRNEGSRVGVEKEKGGEAVLQAKCNHIIFPEHARTMFLSVQPYILKGSQDLYHGHVPMVFTRLRRLGPIGAGLDAQLDRWDR